MTTRPTWRLEGAGIRAARDAIDLGVDAVIVGNVDPEAAASPEAGNVKVYKQNRGTVSKVIQQFKSGRLR